jgi:polysaccharide pyruvyl transferase WcaK-like protein
VQPEDRLSVLRRPIRRLALVTPWAGGNLGNSAILSSVISNVSRRIPSIEFVGVTLSQENTQRRFGIEAFPLAGVLRSGYNHWSTGASKLPGQPKNARARIKQWVKRIPLVVSLLRIARTVRQEIAHSVAAARLVSKLDGVLIPGGGALDEFWGGPWGHPWSLFKWSLISRLYHVPFVFMSVGKCSLERPASRFFARIALRLAVYRSYRELDSKNAVQALICAPDDPVIPDLAFSYPCSALPPPQNDLLRTGRLLVGISPIAYCDPRIWPLKDERRYSAYVRELTQIVKWLLKEGHRLLFFATDSPDLETIKEILTAIEDIPKDPDAIQTLPGPVEQSIDGHLQGTARTDLIVASRLHGVILSHLIARPVLAVSFDPKVNAHMASVNQTDYCLDINTLKLETFIERFEALKTVRYREAAHIRETALAFREQLDSQYDRIFGAKRRKEKESRSGSSNPAPIVAAAACDARDKMDAGKNGQLIK